MSRATIAVRPGWLARLRAAALIGNVPMESDCVVRRIDLLAILGEVDYLRARHGQAVIATTMSPLSAEPPPAADPEQPAEEPIYFGVDWASGPDQTVSVIITPEGDMAVVAPVPEPPKLGVNVVPMMRRDPEAPRPCSACGFEFDIAKLGPHGCPNCHGEGLE